MFFLGRKVHLDLYDCKNTESCTVPHLVTHNKVETPLALRFYEVIEYSQHKLEKKVLPLMIYHFLTNVT